MLRFQETIRRRKAEYMKTEREIEKRLLSQKEDRESKNNIDKLDGGQTPEWSESGDTSQVETAKGHGE